MLSFIAILLFMAPVNSSLDLPPDVCVVEPISGQVQVQQPDRPVFHPVSRSEIIETELHKTNLTHYYDQSNNIMMQQARQVQRPEIPDIYEQYRQDGTGTAMHG